MKAISIQEPWASMILSGLKTIETRKWQTSYRGKILLCASKKPVSKISGYAFAIAELVEIMPMTKEHEKQACCEVYPGAYSWFLKNIKQIPLFPVEGKLSLFDVEVKDGY
jgi:predicted transcriptional regulator